ncbi:general secretion pathway protein GspB [Bermanella marisrubri]|uniref:Type II secretion system protein GspB C-terminal domain-containing protein n=1 Tax=Bermanella marisrubri TaxID=207949 RepID=Q1MXU0_9GAMM|nr:general secretion pathway protein GspB [Bermanella marisrubri]EAT10797.1 hypothetical protein RED65_08699 [Oceanobacter sp. RED65] [Bermanella marisrubri]QIZ84259.1 general secretion pathway protein GspB [Bermanella marisrubri]
MSYLLKALEKAQKEREAGTEKQTQFTQQRNSATIPWWLVVCILLVLFVTVLQVFGVFTLVNDESGSEALNVFPVVETVPHHQGLSDAQSTHKESKAGLQIDKIYTLMELDPQQLALLPSLELQSHIYSPRAEMRSVIINDRNYTEGDLLSANVGLKEITPKGIVLTVDEIKVYLDKGITWVAK